MMQPNYEQQLYEWLWEVMLTLRLHPADLPMPVMQFTQQLPHKEELQGIELSLSWCFKRTKKTVLDCLRQTYA